MLLRVALSTQMVEQRIGHVRYINILTWLRGFQVKPLYLVLFSLYRSLFWELRDKGNLKNLQFKFDPKVSEPCSNIDISNVAYLEMLVFKERGKPDYPEKNLSEQSREQGPGIKPRTQWCAIPAPFCESVETCIFRGLRYANVSLSHSGLGTVRNQSTRTRAPEPGPTPHVSFVLVLSCADFSQRWQGLRQGRRTRAVLCTFML